MKDIIVYIMEGLSARFLCRVWWMMYQNRATFRKYNQHTYSTIAPSKNNKGTYVNHNQLIWSPEQHSSNSKKGNEPSWISWQHESNKKVFLYKLRTCNINCHDKLNFGEQWQLFWQKHKLKFIFIIVLIACINCVLSLP